MHYDPVDLDRTTFDKIETFNRLALKDSASRAESQDILQQIAPRRMGNLEEDNNREKDDVSRGRQLY